MWRVIVLEEIVKWFDSPNSVVELFLNYDMDRKFIQQWNIFEQTCSAFCSIAEGRDEEIDSRVTTCSSLPFEGKVVSPYFEGTDMRLMYSSFWGIWRGVE